MRKISDDLLDRLINGDLVPLLEYVKSDEDLRLEVRRHGDAFIYYRKGKALEIRRLKVDKKYGNVPPTNLAVENPVQYFIQVKECIDNWLSRKKERAEFDVQQKIAQCNQDQDDKYFILDMEYTFSQEKIGKEAREKRASFDLLGIDRNSNRIIFFEVKKGMGATKGKSGIEDHIGDFESFIFGANSTHYIDNLIVDIRNIVEDKTKLGLIHDFELPKNLRQSTIEFVFVFQPETDSQIEDFKVELNDRYELIIIDRDNYKLT